jgi:hypothetical protein
MEATRSTLGVQRWHRWALVHGIAVGAIVIGTLLFSLDFSRSYWGYLFARPPVLREIEDVSTVKAVIPIKTVGEDARNRTIVIDPDYSMAVSMKDAEADRYYCLEARLLMALRRKHLLPARVSMDLTGLPDLHPLIRGTGILEQPEKGYTSDELRGVAIDAVSRSGSRQVFIGVCGWMLSNDHYPYYEMLFTEEPGASRLTYLHGQQFFYDLAGWEGLEWYVVWCVLALSGIACWFAGALVVLGALKAVRYVWGRSVV